MTSTQFNFHRQTFSVDMMKNRVHSTVFPKFKQKYILCQNFQTTENAVRLFHIMMC